MQYFEIEALMAEQARTGRPYHEFLRKRSMSCGLYVLPTGGLDDQTPHAEDELYFVISGQAKITVGKKTKSVEPGSLIFVAAHIEHRFHDITEALKVLVFFAPAET